MNLKQLEYALAVADTGSFTRAAQRCHVVQSALSKQMSALEAELGAQLFHRSNSGIVVNEAGKVFYEYAQGMLKQLDAAKAPKTVANFVQYVKDGHYNGTIFHRVIPNFMVQGGGMNPDMREKPTRAPIALESRNGLSNVRGTIAMARTMNPNSATAQFFINVKDNDFLDAANAQDGNGYAVFGKVVQGMDVVDAIQRGEPPANPTKIVQASMLSENKPRPAAPAPVAAPGLTAPIRCSQSKSGPAI